MAGMKFWSTVIILFIVIMISKTDLINSTLLPAELPAFFMPFSYVPETYTQPAVLPYPPPTTPISIADVASIIRELDNPENAGTGLTAQDIAKLQEIASISNKTLQSASAYLKQLAGDYKKQQPKTGSSNEQPFSAAPNDQLWPPGNPSQNGMGVGETPWNNRASTRSADTDDDDVAVNHLKEAQQTTSSSPPVLIPIQAPEKLPDNDVVTTISSVASESTHTLAIKLGFGIGIPAVLLPLLIILYIIRKRRWLQRCSRRHAMSHTSKPCDVVSLDDCELSGMGKKKGSIGLKLHNSYLSEDDRRSKFAKDAANIWLLEKSRLVVFHEMKLGSGAFCNVYKGAIKGLAPVCKVNPSLIAYGTFKDCMCAVKVLPPFADDIARSDFIQEIKFMKSLKYHPHLVSMLGVCSDGDNNFMLLIEYCDLGDLLHLVRSRKDEIIKGHMNEYTGLRIKDLVSFAWQISNGLEYLSSIGCVHRDVAARNVLVNAANVCKIGDFGLCRLSDCLIYTGRGGRLPLKWMAPESLRSYEYSNKTDVWSYGVLLFEVFSFGEVPYALMQTTEILSFLESGARLSRPEHCPIDIYTLMLQCWQYEAALRPNFTEICSILRVILENSSDCYGYVEVIEEQNSLSDEIPQ